MAWARRAAAQGYRALTPMLPAQCLHMLMWTLCCGWKWVSESALHTVDAHQCHFAKALRKRLHRMNAMEASLDSSLFIRLVHVGAPKALGIATMYYSGVFKFAQWLS